MSDQHTKDAGKMPGKSLERWGCRASAVRFTLLVLLFASSARAHAGATLFIESPINFLGHVSSTGHAAI
ncbi:MAG: hypothetical protein WBE74_01210, partial [Terracidiphilus sp.]